MLVNLHLYMQHPFDVGCRPADIHQQPVGMPRSHRQAIGSGKGNHRLIILLARAKSLGELFGRQKMMVVRTGRVIKLTEQIVQCGRIAQRQANGQIQTLGTVHRPEGRQMGRRRRQVHGHRLPSGGLAGKH